MFQFLSESKVCMVVDVGSLFQRLNAMGEKEGKRFCD